MATTLEAPITAPPAIQIPGSQWRMALKPARPAKPAKPTHLSPSSPPIKHPPPHSKTSQAGPQSPRLSSSNYPVKKSHLAGEKWENCIRMQVAIRPQCRKLLRKISYIGNWKARWRKFDAARRAMGDGWRNIVNPYHGRLMASLAPAEPAKSSGSQGSKGFRPGWGRRKSSKGKRRATMMSLGDMDDLERAWWGDGFPVYMSEEEKRAIEKGRESWLDKVD